MMDQTDRELLEERVEGRTLYTGRILELQVDQARLPNGALATREVVRHPGGVAVLPLMDDGTVVLVRQFRYPFGQVLLEVPAGKLEKGEDHYPAAMRELSEETGLEAGALTYLGSALASPGFCDEELHLYLGRHLTQKEMHPDEDEFLHVVRMPFQEAVEQVMSGAIRDAKTVAAVLKTKVLLGL